MSDDTERAIESAYGHLEPDPAVGERLLHSLPEERLRPRSLATPMAVSMGLLVVVAVTLAIWSGGGPETPTFLPEIRFVTEGDIQKTVEVMRRRLAALGVTGAKVWIGEKIDGRELKVSLPENAPVEIVKTTLVRPGTLEFRIVAGQSSTYFFVVTDDQAEVFRGEDIDPESVTVHPPQGLGFMVGVEFVDDRKDDFADLTRRNLGRRLAIIVDGDVISAPVIQDVIPGRCLITGGGKNGMSKEEAESLAAALRSGAYPGEVEIR
jgi:preprotein translocase subunit SecD